MNCQIWYSTHGQERNMPATSAILTCRLKGSIGFVYTRCGSRWLRAIAFNTGCCMKSKMRRHNPQQAKKPTTMPITDRITRLRNSSRCSSSDMFGSSARSVTAPRTRSTAESSMRAVDLVVSVLGRSAAESGFEAAVHYIGGAGGRHDLLVERHMRNGVADVGEINAQALSGLFDLQFPYFVLDLCVKLAARPAELAHDLAELAGHLGEALRTEDYQRQEHQKEHFPEAHNA